MILIVKKQFGIMDKFEVKYQVAHVEVEGVLPEWVDALLVQCSEIDIRYALDRYADPLVRMFRYTPTQCLDRVPLEARTCAPKNDCVMWHPKRCTHLKKNDCRMLLMEGDTELRTVLTDIVNLWRDGYYVVVAS